MPTQALSGILIERIQLVDRLVRPKCGAFHSASLPGHLLHVMESGEVAQEAAGRQQSFGRGAFVWYHQSEPVRGKVLRAPWVFYTIGFDAPLLPPPPEAKRAGHASGAALRLAKLLHAAWHDTARTPLLRQIRANLLLLRLIEAVYPAPETPLNAARADSPWWAVENWLRKDLSRPVHLADLARAAGASGREVAQDCRTATGMTPAKRVRHLRLDHARGLVLHSQWPIGDIAEKCGYARPQELARDYRAAFGISPTQDRKRGADYSQR